MALSLFQSIVSFGKGVSEAAAEKTKRQDELLKERVKSLQAAALEQNKTRYKAAYDNYLDEEKVYKAVEAAGPSATQVWLVETGQVENIQDANDYLKEHPDTTIPNEWWQRRPQEPMYAVTDTNYSDIKEPSAFGNMIRSMTGREQLPSGEEQLQAQMDKLQQTGRREVAGVSSVPSLPPTKIFTSAGELDKKAKGYKARYPDLTDEEAKVAAAMDDQIRVSMAGEDIDIGRTVYGRIKGRQEPVATAPTVPATTTEVAAVDSGIPQPEQPPVSYEESKRIESSIKEMGKAKASDQEKAETMRFLKESEEFSDRFKNLKTIAISGKLTAEQAPFAEAVADYYSKISSLGIPRQAAFSTAAAAVMGGVDENNTYRTDTPIVDEKTFAQAWLTLGKPDDARAVMDGLNAIQNIEPSLPFNDKVKAININMMVPGYDYSLILESMEAKRSLDAAAKEDPKVGTLSYRDILQRLNSYYKRQAEAQSQSEAQPTVQQ